MTAVEPTRWKAMAIPGARAGAEEPGAPPADRGVGRAQYALTRDRAERDRQTDRAVARWDKGATKQEIADAMGISRKRAGYLLAVARRSERRVAGVTSWAARRVRLG